MTSKATRLAVVALTAAGATAVGATPAFASPPTFYVQQPHVNSVNHVTPESANLIGAVDTGGNPLSHFTVPADSTVLWADSFNITNSTSSPVDENLDGLPPSGSDQQVKNYGASTGYSNGGAENHSEVLFEYDTLKDFQANGNNPGSDTMFATEVDVPTAAGLSAASAEVGAYPAASGLDTGALPLKPGTKYVYWITLQPGATTAAQQYNTYNGTTVTANPTYSCYPTTYAAVTSPYDTYTSTGTITGGSPSTTQREIDGPCVYVYGGGSNYYTSNYRMFTTPKLGFVAFKPTALVAGNKATLKAIDHSVEAARGTLVLKGRVHHKLVPFAHGAFKIRAHHKKSITLTLTDAGKGALAKKSPLTTKVVYTSRTDQPTHSRHVKLK